MSEYDRYEPYESQRRADYEDRWAEPRYNEPARGSYEPKKKRHTGRIVALVLALVVLIGASGVGGGVLYASMSRALVSPVTESEEPAAVPDAGAPEAAESAAPETPAAVPAPEINRGGTLDAQIVGGSSAPTSIRAQYTGDALSAEEIYAMAVNSCVGIQTDVTSTNVFGQVVSGAISGSGFIISSDGYILTNYHVIQTADEQGLDITVNLYNGDSYTAAIVGKDAENDVALIKVDGENLPTLVLNTSGDLMVGQTVYAIGNPLGELTYSMSNGIVSALDREITVESNVSINMFQLTAAINSGNSGGPVLNERGEVIGIASAKYSSTGVEGLGFAIPIEDAMKIVDDLMQYGFVRGKPYFGITVRTITSSIAEYYNWVEGAYIMDVDPYSCAAAAGLQTGDIIIRLDETEIKSSSDLIKAKKDYTAGDTVHLTVYRGGEELQMVLTFDEEGARAFLGDERNG